MDDLACCSLFERCYWYWGVSVSVCNAVCRQRQWKLAISELSGLIYELVDLRVALVASRPAESALSQVNAAIFDSLVDGFAGAEATLRCRLARLLLQVGAVKAGCQCVALTVLLLKRGGAEGRTHVLTDEEAMAAIDEFADSDVLSFGSAAAKELSANSLAMHTALSAGLVYYCRGEYQKASCCFELVMQAEGSRTEVSLTSEAKPTDVFGGLEPALGSSAMPALAASFALTGDDDSISQPLQRKLALFEVVSHAICNMTNKNVLLNEIEFANSTNESIIACATNNFAICALHLKQISRAVGILEKVIKDNPTVYLIDPVVFNLCTMYDLTCAPDVSVQKKKALQVVAQTFSIEDPMLHWRCFRLSSNS